MFFQVKCEADREHVVSRLVHFHGESVEINVLLFRQRVSSRRIDGVVESQVSALHSGAISSRERATVAEKFIFKTTQQLHNCISDYSLIALFHRDSDH